MTFHGKEKVYGSMIRNDATFPRPFQSERDNFLEVGTGISRYRCRHCRAPAAVRSRCQIGLVEIALRHSALSWLTRRNWGRSLPVLILPGPLSLSGRGYWVAVRARSSMPAVVPTYMSRVMR